jgi:hypothetical protein
MAYAKRRRKTMARYGGDPRKRRITQRAAADLESGREDTECRGQPASEACPTPGVAARRHIQEKNTWSR